MVATQTPILLFVNVQNEKTFRDLGYRILWDILVGILVDFEIKQEK